MASIASLLPAPVKSYEVFSDRTDSLDAPKPAAKPVSPYGRRQGFVPRSQDDFGGGGAYPEVHVAQFPLDMGRPGRSAAGSTAIVPLSVDAKTGQARFDAIVTAQHRGKVVHTQFGELVEKRAEEVVRLRPSDEEAAAVAARTQAALTGIVSHALTHARPTQVDPAARNRSEEAKFIRYTPSEDTPGFTAATSQRIIRLVEAPVDPLEPPKFKHKKVPGGPPDAPVPVMHSPPRKATSEDAAAWKVPPSISNWKNPHGYVIPLDKRLAADGRSLLEPVINDNFAKLSEALLIAERKARVEVETRAAIQKRLAVKEKEAAEAELRALAAKARMERAGIANLAAGGGGGEGGVGVHAGPPGAFGGDGAGSEGAAAAAASSARSRGGVASSDSTRAPLLGGAYEDDDDDDGQGGGVGPDDSASVVAGGGSSSSRGGGFVTGDVGGAEASEDVAGARERDRLRGERKRERERELRAEAGGKRSRGARDGDRDVSERIALGMPVGAGPGGAGAEALYDARLFNQAEGMQSGFGADDEYGVYSAPWRSQGASAGASAGYRPRAGLGADSGGFNPAAAEAELARLRDGSKLGGRGGAGKDFEGVAAGGGGGRSSGAPVQFERAVAGTVGASASAQGQPPADPFNLDQFLTTSSSSRPGGGGNALDRIGQKGFLAAAGGGVARSAEEYGGGSGRDKIAFRSGGTTR